jgi:hypothetical protein
MSSAKNSLSYRQQPVLDTQSFAQVSNMFVFCIRTTPIPSAQASVSTTNTSSKLGNAGTGADIIAYFNF